MRWVERLKAAVWHWKLRHEQVPEGFDGAWYCQRYPDVAASGVAPELHYLRFGRFELRDPSPDFSASGHQYGMAQGNQSHTGLPVLPGNQPYESSRPTLMVCAHQAGPELFGAERSLLDILAALRALNVNLVITVPGAFNDDYLVALRSQAWRLAILPYGWWSGTRPAVESTVGHFERLIKKYSVDAVYANTLVLREPILAAQRAGVASAVHIRELLVHDEPLRQILGASADELSAWLTDNVDVLVANSGYTADCLGLERVLVVPNAVSVDQFSPDLSENCTSRSVVVGMVSSNLPKKGLSDFVALAGVLKSAAPGIRCRLIGPDNSHIQQLARDQAKGLVPDNLEFAGYAESPQQALASLDIVVNLSHFQESFGRTVLEAMASGRPVVAYRWGALTELVREGETGYLVSLGDIEALACRVRQLADDPSMRYAMGRAGRELTRQRYSTAAMEGALSDVIELLMEKKRKVQANDSDRSTF